MAHIDDTETQKANLSYIRSTMEEPAWKALPSRAQALYPWLKLQWKGPRHNNNGRVMLSVRCAAQRLGCNKDTAAKAFHDLQAKGFIHVTRAARLGPWPGKACRRPSISARDRVPVAGS